MASFGNQTSELNGDILKSCDFDVKKLLEKGFSIKQLRSVHFDADQFRGVGVR